MSLEGIELIDPTQDSRYSGYVDSFFSQRGRRGLSKREAQEKILTHNYFASMMLVAGDADAMVTGTASSYKTAVSPILEVIGGKEGHILAGVYMLALGSKKIFISDCTMNIDPDAQKIANIAITTANLAKHYTDDPIRIAMLSFASFGTSNHPDAKKMAKAVELVKYTHPHLEIDGEMQVDVALNSELRAQEFPFCELRGDANVLICPNLSSANITYKALTTLASAVPTGPFLVGINKPAHVVQRGASVEEIVNLIYVAAHQSLAE